MKWEFLGRYKSSKTIQLISIWYFTILLALAVIGFTAIPSILQLDKINKDIYTHPFSVSNAAIELRYNLNQIRSHMLKVFIATDKDEIKRLSDEIDSFEGIINRNQIIIRQKFLGDMGKVIEMERLLTEWKLIRKKEFESILSGKNENARNLIKGIGTDNFIQLNQILNYIINYAQTKAESFIYDSEKTMSATLISLSLLVVYILGSGVFVLEKVIQFQKDSQRVANKLKEHFLVEAKIQAEMELSKNKNQLKIITDNIPAIISLVDRNLKFQFVNKRFCELFHITAEECIGKKVIDVLGRPIFEKVYPNYLKALSGDVITYENSFAIKDGKLRHFEIKYTPYIEKGKQLGIIVLSQDVTERKHSEEVLRDSEIRLRESIQNSPYPIMMHAEDGEVILLSNAWMEITGYTINDIPTIKAWTDRAYGEDAAAIRKQIDRLYRLNSIEKEGEFQIKTAYGDIRTWEFQSQPLPKLKDGRLVTLSSAVDITDTRKNEENLRKARDESEIANRLKSEFLANMSHEIRTPMNAILGFAEILKDKVGNNPVVIEYLTGIQKSGKSLIDLINDILDLAKIEAGRLDIVYSPVNLFSIINEVKQIFSLQTNQKRLDFEIAIDEKLPRGLLLDELRLRQVLFNLIGNAVKFTEKGSIKINVICIAKNRESSSIDLVIEIQDTGFGIAEYELDSIFEPFKQQEGQDIMKFGGSGLGLSITRKLVEMMDGTITVESKLGVGSKFSIYMKGLEISSLVNSSQDFETEVSHITFDKSKILLVEDIESNRKVVTGFLEKQNLVIIEAQNGKKALEVLEKENFDLILMDMQMPEMDGKKTSQFLKKEERYNDIPIIILTASAMKENIKDIMNFADGYLCKPITRYELINELARFLPHKKEETEEPAYEPKMGNVLDLFKEYRESNNIDSGFKKEFDEWFTESDNARKSLNTNKLIQYFTELKQISEKYNIEPLATLASNLLQLTKTFSIARIADELSDLDSIHTLIISS